MALSGVTFDGCSVSARDHGVLFARTMPDGTLRGCAVTFNGTSATIAPGYLIACGRVIEVESSTTVAVTGTQYTQIVLTISVTQPTFTLSGVNSTSPDFPALTQDDINDGTSTTYQLELAVIDVANNTVMRSIGASAYPIRIVNAIPTSSDKDGIYLVTE